MAREVTAWCLERRRVLAESVIAKDPAPKTIDIMYRVRKGGTSLLSPESPEGEEWLVANVTAPRLGRSFVVSSRRMPDLVDAAERPGLVCRERFHSTTTEE